MVSAISSKYVFNKLDRKSELYDKLVSQCIPKDIISNNTHRLKEINNAWDLIKNKKYDLNA